MRSSPPSPAPDQVTQPVTREGWRVLSLGQFFFVKIWAGSDLLSVAELQLLWEDKERPHHITSSASPLDFLLIDFADLIFAGIDQVNISCQSSYCSSKRYKRVCHLRLLFNEDR